MIDIAMLFGIPTGIAVIVNIIAIPFARRARERHIAEHNIPHYGVTHLR